MERIPTIELIESSSQELRELYLEDKTPWVVGFSGGKDSSTVVQLVYYMLKGLTPEQRHKTVHVISSDTLVENPMIEDYLDRTVNAISAGALKHQLPLTIAKVMPEIADSFWVNVLGKGYPAPNRFFRWCTERLKIAPTTRYIQARIDEFGSVIILLGARTEESASRAQVLENLRISDSKLRKHGTMPQAYVYTPISSWRAEDVWSYLIATPPPWGGSNNELRGLYRDAASGECPLVIDKSTPSCGQSRFGCWTCTVVDVDSSMEGFLSSGPRYQRMAPLLEYRNKLKSYRDDLTKRESWHRTDATRPRGYEFETETRLPLEVGEQSQLAEGRKVFMGPFRLEVRRELLEDLLRIQRDTRLNLIRSEEIELIRHHWTSDYRVDSMAMLEILERVYGPAARREQVQRERELLEHACSVHGVDRLAIDRMLDLERGYLAKLRKRGLMQAMDSLISELIERKGSSGANS